jgi:hypothetical protein
MSNELESKILSFYPGIVVEIMKKTAKSSARYCPGWDSNRTPSEYNGQLPADGFVKDGVVLCITKH